MKFYRVEGLDGLGIFRSYYLHKWNKGEFAEVVDKLRKHPTPFNDGLHNLDIKSKLFFFTAKGYRKFKPLITYIVANSDFTLKEYEFKELMNITVGKSGLQITAQKR